MRIFKDIFIVLLCLFFGQIFTPTIFSKEATDSTKQATSSSLLKKLDELKKEIASKAAQLKTEVTKKIENKMSLGVIQSIDSSSPTDFKFIIKGKIPNQVILADQYTLLQNGLVKSKKSNLAFKDLKNDALILALGDMDDKNILHAKKIIKLEKYEPKEIVSVMGQVEAINGNKITLKTKDGTKDLILTNTRYRLGNEDGSLSNIELKRVIIGTGVLNQDKQLLTRLIYIPSAVKIASPTKAASSSAVIKTK